MDAYQLRERAWEHFALGNFETAELLFRRAFAVEHGFTRVECRCTEVIL